VTGSSGDAMAAILALVDIVFVANLLLIIIFAGYETFVSKIDTAGPAPPNVTPGDQDVMDAVRRTDTMYEPEVFGHPAAEHVTFLAR